MSIARKTELRLLAQPERELVERTHHPAIARLSPAELAQARRLLRDFHDKARDIARQQKREMRGKADPRGAGPARDNTGHVTKQRVLAQAIKRVNCQIARSAEPEAAA